jgi:hypothetical protein
VGEALPFPATVAVKGDQQKLLAALSALDAKIECNNRMNAELEATARALYDYWRQPTESARPCLAAIDPFTASLWRLMSCASSISTSKVWILSFSL